jgi:hypothetical protein
VSTLALNGRAEIGKFYLVPCIKVEFSARTIWMDVNCWVPVLGPKHSDSEHLNFPFDHYHIDWRFVGHTPFNRLKRERSVLSRVLTNDGTDPWNKTITRSPELRRIKCKREMPEFPKVSQIIVRSAYSAGDGGGQKWARMETAQAMVCNKLKPGNICPHRGIDLTPFIKPDGIVICPGHGLRWDTKTGELLPYQRNAF